jgi:hypothetical protein
MDHFGDESGVELLLSGKTIAPYSDGGLLFAAHQSGALIMQGAADRQRARSAEHAAFRHRRHGSGHA